MTNGPGWCGDGDRDGGRWPVLAQTGTLAAVGATTVAVAADGVGATVGSEALFGVALALLITAGVWWQRARCDRPDVSLSDVSPGARYASGPNAVLLGLGRRWPDNEKEALAEVRLTGRVLAVLYRAESSADLGRAARVHDTVVARPALAESGTGDLGSAGGARLSLEHRQGVDTDLDPSPDNADADHVREVPAVVLRLVGEDGRPVAGAHAYRRSNLDDWVVPTATHTLRLRAARTSGPRYRARPTRRTFLDTNRRPYLARTRRRPKRWELTAPVDLEPYAVLLCLWLVHLLDVHVLLGQTWAAPTTSWTAVSDDFPTWVGPGGFGDSRPITTGGGAYGGGS